LEAEVMSLKLHVAELLARERVDGESFANFVRAWEERRSGSGSVPREANVV